LFAVALLQEESGSDAGEVFGVEDLDVVGAVRSGFPEEVGKIAVVRAGKCLFAAGAVT
jgi:hypothetical protein